MRRIRSEPLGPRRRAITIVVTAATAVTPTFPTAVMTAPPVSGRTFVRPGGSGFIGSHVVDRLVVPRDSFVAMPSSRKRRATW